MFLTSRDTTKVSFSGNGKMSSPSLFDETAVNLTLSFRELKESLCMVESFPGSFFSIAVIRELPPRVGTESPVANEEETPLANEDTLFLDNDDELFLTVGEDSPWTVEEELLLAVDTKSPLMDEEISPLADDEESPLFDNEDTSLVDDEDSSFANEVEFSLVDEGGVDEEESLLDVDVESLLLGEAEFLFVHEGGVPLDGEGGSPLVGEEKSFLDAEVEPFFPGGDGTPLTDEREFLLADEHRLLLDVEEVFSLGSAMCLMLDAVPSLNELLGCICDLSPALLLFSSATTDRCEADADADSVPLFPLSITAVSCRFFLSSSLPFVPASPLLESSFFFSSDRVSFRGLLFLPLFPLGLSEEGPFFGSDLSLASLFVVSSDVLLPSSSLLGGVRLWLLLPRPSGLLPPEYVPTTFFIFC